MEEESVLMNIVEIVYPRMEFLVTLLHQQVMKDKSIAIVKVLMLVIMMVVVLLQEVMAVDKRQLYQVLQFLEKHLVDMQEEI
ncbi:MAG: hypothetical protein DI529_13765 [Chryseobacterium sp.]|nr:MAG: hypothetical protein DI529_13765 [Chryseobacterium sp.]